MNVALITDAGLPSISDPGARLVRACVEAGVPYTVIPGPSAVLTAVVGSGLSVERFYYGGFVAPKSGGRERDLQAALDREETTVLFESRISSNARSKPSPGWPRSARCAWRGS